MIKFKMPKLETGISNPTETKTFDLLSKHKPDAFLEGFNSTDDKPDVGKKEYLQYSAPAVGRNLNTASVTKIPNAPAKEIEVKPILYGKFPGSTSFNFFDYRKHPLLHGGADVAPWVLWGNSLEDKTTLGERIVLPIVT